MSCLNLLNNNSLSRLVYTCSNLFQIKNCKFINLGDINDQGGAISLTSSNSNCTIEKSIFLNCFSSYGGSFYVYNSNYILINNNCFSNCFSLEMGQCIYSHSIYEHNFNDNSIEYCSKNGDKGRSSVCIHKGTQNFLKGNISNNWIQTYDVLLLYDSINAISNFNNIIKNNVTIAINVYGCIQGNFSFSNIIKNNKVENSYALIFNSQSFQNCLFFSSIILNNDQLGLFNENNNIIFNLCSFNENSFIIPINILNNLNFKSYDIIFNYICYNKNSINVRNFKFLFKKSIIINFSLGNLFCSL